MPSALARRRAGALAATLATLAGVGLMLWLGSWQLDRARADSGDGVRPEDRPTSSLLVVSTPLGPPAPDAVGQRVELEGELRGDLAVDVPGPQGALWTTTPLVLSNGVAMPVVGSAPVVDSGPRSVLEGVLQPPSGESEAVPRGLSAQALQAWPFPVYDGWVALDDVGQLVAGRPDSDIAWRNYAYAAQWVVFAGFTLALWRRWVRDARTARETGAAAP